MDDVRGGHLDAMRVGEPLLASICVLAACNGSVLDTEPAHSGTDSGVEASVDAGMVIGTPCLPSQENGATFDGYSNEDVNIDSTPASGEPTCVVDHFRGLVTCPYGQTATGQPPAGGSACTTTDGQPVAGMVEPQCTDRPAAKVVVWSCRCANTQGETNDGHAYCTCPSSTVCMQLVAPIGMAGDDISGAYCMPPGALTDGGEMCSVACSPMTAPCP